MLAPSTPTESDSYLHVLLGLHRSQDTKNWLIREADTSLSLFSSCSTTKTRFIQNQVAGILSTMSVEDMSLPEAIKVMRNESSWRVPSEFYAISDIDGRLIQCGGRKEWQKLRSTKSYPNSTRSADVLKPPNDHFNILQLKESAANVCGSCKILSCVLKSIFKSRGKQERLNVVYLLGLAKLYVGKTSCRAENLSEKERRIQLFCPEGSHPVQVSFAFH